jgi:hypothetical protein
MDSIRSAGFGDDLKSAVISVLAKKAKDGPNTNIPYIEAFMQACNIEMEKKSTLVEANPQIRHRLLEDLLRNGYVILSPEDVDGVLVTQKCIDKVYPSAVISNN